MYIRAEAFDEADRWWDGDRYGRSRGRSGVHI